MKILSFALLMGMLAVLGGCSYSATHTSDASVSVNSNGKVQSEASSAVYTERIENGKTVNNSAVVTLGTNGAAANMTKTTSTNKAASVTYTAEDADLRRGEAQMYGYFVNTGNTPVKINKVHLIMTFTDEKGKVIWEDETDINNLNLTIKPNSKEVHDFVIVNPNAPAYNGAFDMKFTMNYSE